VKEPLLPAPERGMGVPVGDEDHAPEAFRLDGRRRGLAIFSVHSIIMVKFYEI
jgi:hypothetical protein